MGINESNDEDGLVCAYLQWPDGRWQAVDWDGVRAWRPGDGLLWMHFNRSAEATRSWLHEGSGLDALVADNLLAEETRPRALAMDGNLLVNLRGVNLNPGADPDDMVSLRIWLEPGRIVTSRRRRLMAIDDIREHITRGKGPRDTGDFLVEVAGLLVNRMSPVIEQLDEAADDLEEQVVTGEREDVRTRLASLRRQAISLRRYLAPQREALSRILGEPVDWLHERHKAQLREISDRTMRYVEDLDAIRERAAVIQDEVANRVAESMNKNMYMLAIVATIMLPLGFITGLLGVNVDGLPGAHDAPWAFAALSAFLLVLVFLQVLVMRRLKWF
ncbi:zinc transporter ZntB [Parazoarcus communis]|uniref:zinc transporter ZntB n=1 Tax=Parazoarcus communis TaxID=41977 RepID=UPI0019018D48|nr:zinc transporter ZntB [Parazoarcus communis]